MHSVRAKLKVLVPLGILFVFTILVRTGVISFGTSTQVVSKKAAVTITAGEVQYVKKLPALTLTGSVEGETSAVISPKISGKIAAVFIEDGKAVTAGQELIRLENIELSNSIQQGNDTVLRAKANYENAQTNYNRYLILYQQKAVSKQQLDSMETSLKVAQSDLSSAYAALSTAEQQFGNASILAPVTGFVANKAVTIGQVVSVGQQVMTVENIEQVYAVVNVEQKDIGNVIKGMKANITVDSFPGHVFSGTVDILNPTAGTATRVFRVKIEIDNPELKLKPGMFVKVDIITGEAVAVMAVPQSAVFQKQGLYYVFTAEDGKAIRHQVDVGQILDDKIEIRSGLSEKSIVVTSNINNLKDGDMLSVTK